jgi:hypothetical protein
MLGNTQNITAFPDPRLREWMDNALVRTQPMISITKEVYDP